MNEKSFKISLKAARVNANYTQEQVAKKLKIDKGTLINWEKGKSSPTVQHFNALCALYKTPANSIFLP